MDGEIRLLTLLERERNQAEQVRVRTSHKWQWVTPRRRRLYMGGEEEPMPLGSA
jgi:hypothetical protein